MKLSPENNNHKKSSSILMRNCKINTEQKTTSFSTTSVNINSNNNLSQKNQKKIEFPLEFIKQKKKFKIENLFDCNGTKDFLASKEEAMMEIKLEDEIINEKDNKNSKIINTNLLSIDYKNENDIGKKNKNSKKTVTFSSIEDKTENLNSKKYKESKYKKKGKRNDSEGNVKFNKNNYINNNDNNNILIIDELNNHSKESNFFYKFIIENANESEDAFQKKLNGIIKNVENKKKIKDKKGKNLLKLKKHKINEILRSNSAKNPEKNHNIFIYSERVKNLMENDNMEISSIGSNNKNVRKNCGVKNDIKIEKDIFFGEKEREIINGVKNDSLISFLNEFYKN